MLETGAAEAKAAQLRLETDLAKQREKTANAEKALLQLRASLADRRLTKEQQSDLVKLLTPWRGIDVDVLVWGDTAEIEIISGQLMESLAAAGWNIHVAHAGGGGAVRGILVANRPDAGENPALAAKTLVHGLRSAQLASDLWNFEGMVRPVMLLNSTYTGTAPIRVFIGSKPPN
jgi:hypothetical protein